MVFFWQVEEAEEARYASQFRLEGEAYMAKGVDRKRDIKRKQRAYARTLKDQVRFDSPHTVHLVAKKTHSALALTSNLSPKQNKEFNGSDRIWRAGSGQSGLPDPDP